MPDIRSVALPKPLSYYLYAKGQFCLPKITTELCKLYTSDKLYDTHVKQFKTVLELKEYWKMYKISKNM